MTDRDRFELEMSPGMQPPSGLGDRVLVGLALLVLIGGAAIAVVRVLPDADQVAQGSQAPSSRPPRTPRPVPTPEPPRVATLEDPDVEFSPQQPYSGFDGWIRALDDIAVRSNPDPEAGEVGVLTSGELAYANSPQDRPDLPAGWLLLQDPSGWIQSVVGGVDQVRRYEYPRYRYSGSIDSIVAGPDGFVAMVMPPGGPDSYEARSTAISSDGGSWRGAGETLVDSWNGGAIAWGPAGWLAASYVTDNSLGLGRVLIWSSADGLQWTRLGMLGGVTSEFVTQLLGSEQGYLLETYPEQGGYSPNGGTLWSSADGLTWVESKDPVLTHTIYGDRRITALRRGFYLWDTGGDPVNRDRIAAFSADGQTWSELDHGPDGIGLQLADLGGGIVAIDLNRDSLAARVWSGVLVEGRVSWIRETASDEAFAGGVVQRLVSDGTRVFAFGWDASTEEPLVWSGNGVTWVRSALPESFGGIPTLAAAGPSGVVVVGHRHTLRGDNPIFWHRTATGRWVPEPEPILEAVPDPAAADCRQPPIDLPEFNVVDVQAVISCLGATPFTFRAFSFACGECYGTMSGNPQPAWLLNPTDNLLFLAPSETHTDWSATAALGPLLKPDQAWRGAWIEITGHYDDPAALTCRQEVDADSVEWWSGRTWLIDQCRATFVVTAVKVVSGP
jgi:hypothetical protein